MSLATAVIATTASVRWRPILPIGRYALRFVAEDPVSFPAYSGSAWRGVLGHALRRSVCVTRAPTCGGCLLIRSCVYPYVFETPPPLDGAKMRRYAVVPHPYALVTDATGGRSFAPGDDVEVGLTLFGRANAHLPYFVHALSRAGERGIGRGQGRLRLGEIFQITGTDGPVRILEAGGALEPRPASEPTVPSSPESARILLHTPLRLKRGDHLVRCEEFRFADLFASLLRRISMLTYFHTDTPLEADFASLTRLAREVAEVRTALRWQDWTRYSSRQKTTMQMGGLMGEIVLERADWSAFWPYLWLGQWIHAGKGATMGLGRYTIETPQACGK